MKAVILAAVLGCAAATAQAEPARERVCYSARETREKIAAHGLAEPLRLMRATAGRLQADAVAVKLCLLNQELVYEISLVRRDGRVIRVYLNASNGQSPAARGGHEEAGRAPAGH
jgi:uncharacterized membrane protein YkoI